MLCWKGSSFCFSVIAYLPNQSDSLAVWVSGTHILHNVLGQASKIIQKFMERSWSKNEAMEQAAPALAEAESIRVERDELRSKLTERELELKAKTIKLQDLEQAHKSETARLQVENIELGGIVEASKAKISNFEEINKKIDETIKRTLADHSALKQEFEEYKEESQNIVEQYVVQLEAMKLEHHRLCVAVGPILDKLYPGSAGTNADSVDQVADLLKIAPERLKDLAREHATMGCN